MIRLPRISNFTDFVVLECREEVSLRYVSKAGDFGNPDLVILPGSKNTMEDLLWLRQSGLEGKSAAPRLIRETGIWYLWRLPDAWRRDP